MSRTRRLKIMGECCYYHFVSRTVGQEFYLGDTEKERLLNIIRYFRIYALDKTDFFPMV